MARQAEKLRLDFLGMGRYHVQAHFGSYCAFNLKASAPAPDPPAQYVLPSTREAVMAFVRTLPIRKIPGVGKVCSGGQVLR